MFRNALKLAFIGFVVAVISASAQQLPAGPTVTRTPLRTQDLPMPGGYVATMVLVELPAGAREGRHMHSGTLVAYVKEGAVTMDYEGLPSVTYKTGETFSVEPGKVHEGLNKGNVTARVIATFVFPKAEPMTTQVTK